MPKRKGQRQRKRNRGPADIRAPKDNRLGRTSSWTLTEIIPIYVSSGNYQAAGEQSTIRVSTHLNGFYVQVLNQNLQNLFTYHDDYGVATGQFSHIADLYEQYRLVNVSMVWKPAQTYGIYTMAAPLAWIDPSGESGNYPVSLEEWARSPAPVIGDSHSGVRLQQPYQAWLTENLDHPYLQTIDPSSLQRERYTTEKAPGLALWQTFTPLSTSSDQLAVIGTLVIRVHYEFRGTRTGSLQNQLSNFSLKMPQVKLDSFTSRNDLGQVEDSKSNSGELPLSASCLQSSASLKKLIPEVLGKIDHLTQRVPVKK